MITNLETTISENLNLSDSPSDPLIVCATDDAYVMPLTAMLYSAGQNLREGSQIRVMILDGGVSDENKQKLKESIVDLPVEISWISFNAEILNQFEISHHVSHTAYYRLLLSEVLPASISRILYLDCDLLIRGDLVELWEMDLENHTMIAIPDIACPNVDASSGMENYKRANPYLAAVKPIQNYSDLGISADSQYFNSGVMLIDLDRWRDLQMSQKLLKCMSENQDFIWCWDQYALNVVLNGEWKPAPVKWNMGTHALEYPSPQHSPVCPTEFQQMLDDPQVVHFTTEWKPWHYGIKHPYREDFFATLNATVWQGWQPEKPAFSIRRMVDQFMLTAIKHGTIAYRRLTTAW